MIEVGDKVEHPLHGKAEVTSIDFGYLTLEIENGRTVRMLPEVVEEWRTGTLGLKSNRGPKRSGRVRGIRP